MVSSPALPAGQLGRGEGCGRRPGHTSCQSASRRTAPRRRRFAARHFEPELALRRNVHEEPGQQPPYRAIRPAGEYLELRRRLLAVGPSDADIKLFQLSLREWQAYLYRLCASHYSGLLANRDNEASASGRGFSTRLGRLGRPDCGCRLKPGAQTQGRKRADNSRSERQKDAALPATDDRTCDAKHRGNLASLKIQTAISQEGMEPFLARRSREARRHRLLRLAE